MPPSPRPGSPLLWEQLHCLPGLAVERFMVWPSLSTLMLAEPLTTVLFYCFFQSSRHKINVYWTFGGLLINKRSCTETTETLIAFPFHILGVVCWRFQLRLKLFVNKENGGEKKSDQLKVYSSKCLKAFIWCSIFFQFCNWEFAESSLHLFLIQGRMTIKAWLFLYKGCQK